MPFAPEPFRKSLVATLTDAERPAYGQVATIDAKGRPQVRTVHLRYLEGLEGIPFAAHIKSPKWIQLEKNNSLSGCLLDLYRNLQFRWVGTVNLICPTNSTTEAKAVLDWMWSLVRPDVRSAYWLASQGIPLEKEPWPECDITKRCPTFGTVVCLPTLWDVLELAPEDYRRDRRTLFSLEDRKWTGRRVSGTDSRDLRDALEINR